MWSPVCSVPANSDVTHWHQWSKVKREKEPELRPEERASRGSSLGGGFQTELFSGGCWSLGHEFWTTAAEHQSHSSVTVASHAYRSCIRGTSARPSPIKTFIWADGTSFVSLSWPSCFSSALQRSSSSEADVLCSPIIFYLSWNEAHVLRLRGTVNHTAQNQGLTAFCRLLHFWPVSSQPELLCTKLKMFWAKWSDKWTVTCVELACSPCASTLVQSNS